MSVLQSIKDLTLGPRAIDHATADLAAIDTIKVGEEAAKHFLFQHGYRNLNHGIALVYLDTAVSVHADRLKAPLEPTHVQYAPLSAPCKSKSSDGPRASALLSLHAQKYLLILSLSPVVTLKANPTLSFGTHTLANSTSLEKQSRNTSMPRPKPSCSSPMPRQESISS